MIHGLIEADVTTARATLRAYKAKSGEALSFTAFIATCLAKAVDEQKAVQAFPLGRKRLILFDDVDINIRIEREVAGRKIVVPYIIRAANRKSFRQKHDEIRAAQVAGETVILARYRLLSLMPTMVYGVFAQAMTQVGRVRPRLWKRQMGTVGLTAVGMFGDDAGWGIPASSPSALMLTVGGIGQKQTIVDGRATVREYLSLTISVDHNVVDGAPAARFAQRLKQLIESGYGLEAIESVAASGQTGAARPTAQTREPADTRA
jgi:pyruvate/2-oxoglutarate dehydrogenase complex dihydrolipoamide acyltransferase (E2) component